MQLKGAVGTPNYMAPELWKGSKPSVASDIYSLGVILHELVSGRRPEPFREDPSTWKPPVVHRRWDRILRGCLHPDPLRRFRDVDEVARALAPSPIRRRIVAAALVTLLILVSGWSAYLLATAPKESVRLALLPFTFSGETERIAENLSRDTAGQLGRLKGSSRMRFTHIPLAATLANKVDTPEKARRVLGATHVLHGTLLKEKDGVAVRAYLTDARSGITAKEWKATYAPAEARYGPVALAGLVTGTFRLPPAQAAATMNAAARPDYLAGLYHLRRNSGADTGLVHMQRAVAADSDSPLTHAGLAEALWLKYFTTQDQTYLDAAIDSARQAERRHPDLPEVHRISGLLQANSGWYEQAAAEYRRSIELDPGNSDAHRRLGMAYESNDQLSEALAEFRRAIELEPRNYRNHQALGNFYNQTADYREAANHFQKAVELAPDEPIAHFALGSAFMNLGYFTEAESEFRSALKLGETPDILNSLGVVLSYQGRNEEAIVYLSRALSRWPTKQLWWMNLATAYRRLNRTDEAERAYRRAWELALAEINKNPRSGYARACMAYLSARLRDRRRAEAEIAQALQLSPNDADARWMAVKTYEVLGRRDDTLAVLSASPKDVLADASRYPDLADLRRDPRFLSMLGSARPNN
jgi:Flp pilus assembly protein TadD/TolB-like protein